MKIFLLFGLALAIILGKSQFADKVSHNVIGVAPANNKAAASPAEVTGDVSAAAAAHLRNVWVQGEGIVTKLLPDDNQGSRHQKFLLRTQDGVSVLVAHNIDIAPRLNELAVGDTLSFSGEYIWNEKGGVLHWTHKDPRGQHAGGWLRTKGVTYQ